MTSPKPTFHTKHQFSSSYDASKQIKHNEIVIKLTLWIDYDNLKLYPAL